MHISIGHLTVMANVIFFCDEAEADGVCGQLTLISVAHPLLPPSTAMTEPGPIPAQTLDFGRNYLYCDALDENSPAVAHYAVLQFQKPVTCTADALVIGSKLDTDASANTVGLGCGCHVHP